MQLFLQNLKKISTAVKNHGDCKNTEKTGHPPLKKLIIEKNGLLLDKVTQRCQTFEAGTARVLLGVGKKKVFEKSSYTMRKRRKTEKNEEKKLGARRDSNPAAACTLQASWNSSLPVLKTGKVFVSFSPALQRMTLKLAEIPILLVCNDP